MSASDDFPFRQWTDVKRTDRFISVEPLSGYRLIRPEDESSVIYLAPDTNNEELGRALLESLDRSRFIHPDEDPTFTESARYAEAYRKSEKNFMRRCGYKTKRDAYKSMDWCQVKRRDGKIFIELFMRDKPGTWKGLPSEPDIVIPATDDALVAGAALRRALDLGKAASEAEGR
jgi:hypothetical protein